MILVLVGLGEKKVEELMAMRGGVATVEGGREGEKDGWRGEKEEKDG